MLSSSLLLTLLLPTYHASAQAQMVSYGMRRLALSTNQFGLDLLRAMERTGRDSLTPSYLVGDSVEGNDGSKKSYAFCPFCIGASLAMLMTGLAYTPRQNITEEATESAYESLRYALYLNNMQPQEINLAYLDLMRHLQVNLPGGFRSRRSIELSEQPLNSLDSPPSNLMRITNQMYVQRHLPVDYHYYVLTQHYYCTPMRSLELAYAGEESRQHINAVVEQATAGKVPELLSAGVYSLSYAKLLLLSAMYFEGKLDLRQAKSRSALHALWPYRKPLQQYQHQGTHPVVHVHGQMHRNRSTVRPYMSTTSTMPPSTMSTGVPASFPTTTSSNTGFNPFKPLRNSSTWVTKESIRLRYTRSTYLNATVVEMPLVGGILTMLVLVPETHSAIELMLSRINAQLVVDLMQNLEIRRVDITVPVINASYSMPNLRQVLSRMGLAKLFKPSDSLFDESTELPLFTFAGIEGFPLSQVMHLQHQTVLDLSVEEHTEPHQSYSRMVRNLGYKQDSYFSMITSPILRIVSSTTSEGRDKKLGTRSKGPSGLGGMINAKQRLPPVAGNKPSQRRTYISLEDEFLYLIVDNISGLILTMGIYRS